MGKRKYKVNIFSRDSIEQLRKDLLGYRDSLEGKCEELVEKLAELGEKVALEKVSESPLGKTIHLRIDREPMDMGCRAILIATGEVKESEGFAPFHTVLAVEFGAGIYHNKVANPKAEELGFGVGTFPGQIHAFESGWFYLGEDDEWHYTHGVKATMPMYSASMEILQSVERAAREVFK